MLTSYRVLRAIGYSSSPPKPIALLCRLGTFTSVDYIPSCTPIALSLSGLWLAYSPGLMKVGTPSTTHIKPGLKVQNPFGQNRIAERPMAFWDFLSPWRWSE